MKTKTLKSIIKAFKPIYDENSVKVSIIYDYKVISAIVNVDDDLYEIYCEFKLKDTQKDLIIDHLTELWYMNYKSSFTTPTIDDNLHAISLIR